MDKNLALMDRIMGSITQSDEWNEIQIIDPQISNADTRWHGAMEQVRDLIPDGLYDELCDAHVTEYRLLATLASCMESMLPMLSGMWRPDPSICPSMS